MHSFFELTGFIKAMYFRTPRHNNDPWLRRLNTITSLNENCVDIGSSNQNVIYLWKVFFSTLTLMLTNDLSTLKWQKENVSLQGCTQPNSAKMLWYKIASIYPHCNDHKLLQTTLREKDAQKDVSKTLPLFFSFKVFHHRKSWRGQICLIFSTW